MGIRKYLREMWVKHKRLLLFVAFYVMSKDNAGHGAWEEQTSIGSSSSEVSELRRISATCYCHEIASALISWPQHRATPSKALFLPGAQENTGPQGGLCEHFLGGVFQGPRWRGLPSTSQGVLKL